MNVFFKLKISKYGWINISSANQIQYARAKLHSYSMLNNLYCKMKKKLILN